MKRYILKKDLPTFNKGETFIMPDEWLRRESDNIPVYSDYDLENHPNILKDWFEEIPEENKRWRASIYFKTEEEAKKARDWLKAFTVLRDDTKGFKPNWKDKTEDKYFVAYDHYEEEFWIGFVSWQQGRPIYFKSKEDAKASIKAHEKEWLTYFSVEDEK